MAAAGVKVEQSFNFGLAAMWPQFSQKWSQWRRKNVEIATPKIQSPNMFDITMVKICLIIEWLGFLMAFKMGIWDARNGK